MARKRRQVPSRCRTPRTGLDRLPQFEPDHTFRLEETQHESALPFPKNRARQIRDILSTAMKDHVREARFQGEPTSLKQFIANATRAIATYESRSLRRRLYDRGSAIKAVTEVRRAIWTLQQALKCVVEWKQLERYLEILFVATVKQNTRPDEVRAASKRPEVMLKRHVRALLRQTKLADQYREQYRSTSPRGMLNQLTILEPRLTLALEKLEFQPGDFQRDEIVREFVDAMVAAWMSATGEVPTISKSKRPLPFQQLLATINREILRCEIRHKTDFRSAAVLAADKARRRMKGKTPAL